VNQKPKKTWHKPEVREIELSAAQREKLFLIPMRAKESADGVP
jgi:hypothetical protein